MPHQPFDQLPSRRLIRPPPRPENLIQATIPWEALLLSFFVPPVAALLALVFMGLSPFLFFRWWSQMLWDARYGADSETRICGYMGSLLLGPLVIGTVIFCLYLPWAK